MRTGDQVMKKILILPLITLLAFSSCMKKEDGKNGKTINLAIRGEVKGLDPIYANDYYSGRMVAKIYESLLEYHYLARPYKLVPNLAESMPTITDNGLTYTFKIKKGVMFHDDAAFPEGKGRELVAQDFVYSIKRLSDPKLQGLGFWLIDGKIKGLNEWKSKNATKSSTDYSEKIEGLQALDSHTLQFKLTKPFPQFLYSLAMGFTAAVPKEAVVKYGKEFLNHPVGTGPFTLPVFKQGNKIVFHKNKNFRKKTYPCDGTEDKELLKDCGKQLPLVDTVVENIIKEDQPRWLNFLKGKIDLVAVPKDNFDAAIPDAANLSPDYVKKKISLIIVPGMDVTYTAFNHDLKIFQNTKLRQAMSLAVNINEQNKKFFNSTGLPAQSIVPPGIAGHMGSYKNPYRGFGRAEDIARAKQLLVEAGFPGGKGLPEITYDCPSSTTSRQIGEFFKKEMAKIGINIKVSQNTWPAFQKKITNRQVMTYGISWLADYPDAENFFQLIYGPNRSPGANGSGYNNPLFNQMFKKSATMQDSPERTALYEKMYKFAGENVPWIYGVHRKSYALKHGWVKNYKKSDFDHGNTQYYNLDEAEKVELKKNL